jgi:vacuole morphology and inheritance protein 14
MSPNDLQSSSVAASVSTRSKINRDEIKWQELLLHFRSVQAKHEKARRQTLGNDTSPILGFTDDRFNDSQDKGGRSAQPGPPPLRRRVTGDITMPNNIVPLPPPASRAGALSPLNPRARGGGGLTLMPSSTALPSNLNPAAALTHAQKQRRPLELNRK